MKFIKKFVSFVFVVFFILLIGLFVIFFLFEDEPANLAYTGEDAPDVIEVFADNKGFSELFDSSEAMDEKPYTILMYLNGTNLESDYGSATLDLLEMRDSEFNDLKVNMIILTGGTQNWKNDAVSETTSIYRMTSEGLIKLVDFGNAKISDVSLLSAFVDYGTIAFPAKKYGFIFWNHGGGSIHGYGSDDNYDGEGMSLLDIEKGFENSYINDNGGFEFIGFDCCLMSTLETAYMLEPYAKYLIASEELEPGYGWNYNWLKTLSDNSGYDGLKLGKAIVDTYTEFYIDSEEETTLSVIDLSKADNLASSFENFMNVAGNAVKGGKFNTISKARKGTKTFGYAGEDNQYDIVDIKHLAKKLSKEFPKESQNVIDAVEKAVVYYKNSDYVNNAYGVSAYIPYAQKDIIKYSLKKYKELGVMPVFSDFLTVYSNKLLQKAADRSDISRAKPLIDKDNQVSIKLDPETLDEINKITFTIWKQLEEGSDFFIKLGLDTNVEIAEDGTIKTAFDGYWATLGGKTACFYEVENGDGLSKYSTPAILNGKNVNIIVIFDEANPDGKILGAIPENENSNFPSKQMIKIKKDDKLSLKYFAQLFLENEADADKYTENSKWITGDEFTVGKELKIEIVPVDDELYLYGFWIEDIYNNNYYTDFIEIKF